MPQLTESLSRLNADRLKQLVALLPADAPRLGRRKDELIAEISRQLAAPRLQPLWAGLDELSKRAVAEAAHAIGGTLSAQQFRAKYGKLPEFQVPSGEPYVEGPPTRLALFLHPDRDGHSLPDELRLQLLEFVPEPEPDRLRVLESLPECTPEEALTVRLTQADAMADLTVMLRLADQGKVRVGEKTSLPGSATLQAVVAHLSGGDFYAASDKPEHAGRPAVGAIKAFAWPVLLQAAGLVKRDGTRLVPSAAGRKAVGAPSADVLRTVWDKWQSSSLLDEFSRVDAIKGQKSAGRVMTDVTERRLTVAAALRGCPVGEWFDVDEFSRYMQGADCLFEVTHDPWKLYIEEREYGSLGFAGSHDWAILQLRYLMCVLFEVAATLGIVDVAYVSPFDARDDFAGLWGAGGLPCLSRYDGLRFVRLTPLGAYILGLSPDYVPTGAPSTIRVSVLPSLRVHIVAGRPTLDESLTLDTWAAPLGDDTWQLDRQRAIAAIERGHPADDLRRFLQARDDQPLPDAVEAFIGACRDGGKALKVAGTTMLIECRDAATAALVAGHKETAAYCLRAGDKHLAVRLEHEGRFRVLIRILGLGLAG